MDAKSAVQILASIAQVARLEIFRLLVQAGPEGMAAGVIAENLGIPASTLSCHLNELTHAGLVTPQPQSRFIYYSANYAAMNTLLAYLTENCCAGRQNCAPGTACNPQEKETTA